MKSVCCLALLICHIELEFQKSTAVNLRNPLRSLWLSIGRAQPIGAWRQRKCRCGKSLYSSLFAFLSNYAYINLNDPIGRSYGVGRSEVFGAGQYAMRLWIKPDQLAKLGITVTDITNAIQAQNKVNPAGQIGGEPAQKNQQFTYALLAKGRLRSPEQFGNIVVRESPNGGTVRVKDVARAALGQQD